MGFGEEGIKNDNNTKKKICDIRTKQKNPER
jgi:hypothetical protein